MSQFKGRDIITTKDFSKDEIIHILDCSKKIKENGPHDFLKGYILGNCFYEPSTRTKLSFEAAMLRSGGHVIGFSDSKETSIQKGETLKDSIKMLEGYADVVVLRHPHEGAAQHAADVIDIPVINAGDGANQHPTQTFLDLFSIRESQGTLEELSIAFVGDLKYGRTVHSLSDALVHFKCRLYFVSPPSLEMPQEICDALRAKGIKFSFHTDLEEILPKLDILYMTRIQKERLSHPMELEKLSDRFVLKESHLKKAKPTLRVLHPLPRNGEIDLSVDNTPHAYYFEQAKNGLFTRQALLGLVLGKDECN